ncbi:MAG TPA: lamin tail domain-containing protein [Patescibacteria group bacterium]|jgi:hypothetical protein
MKKLLLILALVVLPLPVAAADPSPSPNATPVPKPVGGEVRINEFLPNPEGADSGNEWVELKNVSSKTLDVGGLKLKRQSGTTLVTVPAGTVLEPGGILSQSASSSMTNGGDTIELWADTVLIDQVTYDVAEDGMAWTRLGTGEGAWTDVPTPGEENPAEVPAGTPDTGTAADPTSATTRAPVVGSSSVARRTATAPAKRGPLPKSGPDAWPYVLPVLLATLYAYKAGI